MWRPTLSWRKNRKCENIPLCSFCVTGSINLNGTSVSCPEKIENAENIPFCSFCMIGSINLYTTALSCPGKVETTLFCSFCVIGSVQQQNFFASCLSPLGGSHIGWLFNNEEQKIVLMECHWIFILYWSSMKAQRHIPKAGRQYQPFIVTLCWGNKWLFCNNHICFHAKAQKRVFINKIK